jgi:UDP-glucose 4-epimerase
MKPDKYLITGGAGFIGSQVGHALAREGHHVLLIDNIRYGHLDNLIIEGKTFGTFICNDIRCQTTASVYHGVDTVIHLAGISALPINQIEPAEAYSCNVGGTGSVLEYARQAGVRRVIFSSTSAVYENNRKIPMSEVDEICPDLIYALTKQAAENLCRGFAETYNFDILTVRFFNVYGPHQDFNRTSPPFTSYLARELVAGRVPTLYNNTDAARDYVHVDDVITILKKMILSTKKFRGDIFNICSGQGFSAKEIYRQMQCISGFTSEPHFGLPDRFWDAYPQLFTGSFPLSRDRIKSEVFKNSIGDPSKTAAEFDWRASMSLRNGLTSVYEYARRHSKKH